MSTAIHPTDQAAGLRRLFAGQQRRCLVPVAANLELDDSPYWLEALARAFAALGARVLVVDAGELAPTPSELIDIDLATCIVPVHPSVAYLAARGVPRRHVDARGSSAAWLAQLQAAAPWADCVLLHASARELARLLPEPAGDVPIVPIVLAGHDAESLTEAYAAMKQLQQRRGCLVFDAIVGSPAAAPRRARQVAERLASCADAFLAAVLRHSAQIDPRNAQAMPAALTELATLHLAPTVLDAHESAFTPIC